MRLLQLHLERFRHFRDKSLVLAREGTGSAGKSKGLSVVYGPNEAGKTTVLWAIRSFLFGFRDKSPEFALDFEQSELRIGALVELDNGRRFEATRTKGRKQTLFGRSLDGGEEFDEEWFHARLSHPSRAVFENVFGFSLEMLARGAESLKEHEVKSAIYGAGFGGNVDLEKLLGDLRKERESLFKEGGKVPRINQLARSLDERRRAVRQATTPSEEHRRATDQLREQKQLAESTYAAESARRAEAERARAVTLAIEPYRRLREAEAELSGLTWPSGFGADSGRAYEKLVTLREQVREELASLDERLRETRDRLGEWPGDPEVLMAGDEIDALVHDLGAYKKALAERPKNDDALDRLGRRTGERLREMHPSWDLPALREMRFDAVGTKRDFSDAAADHERLRAEREQWSRRGAAMEALGRQREQQRRKLDAALAADASAAALPDPAAMIVPPVAEVARYEALMAEAERELQAARSRRADLKARLSAHREELSAIEASGRAPAERELESARTRRQIGWRLIERALLSGAGSVEEDAKRYGEGEPLPRAYERAVAQADDVADQMRVRADVVQKRALYEALAAQLGEQLREVDAEIARAEAAEQERRRAWCALWARSGLSPLGPGAMRRWLEDRQGYVDLDASFREEQAAWQREGERLDAAEEAWSTRFSALVQGMGLARDLGAAKALRTVEELADLRRSFLTEEQHLVDASLRLTKELAVYEERLRALDPALAMGDVVRAVERLAARLSAAREAVRMREELARARKADEHRAAAAAERLAKAEEEIRAYRALAGQSDDEGVRRVVAIALRADALKRTIDEQRRVLLRAGARWGSEAFLAEVESAAPELLEHRIATLEQEADAMRERARTIDQEVGKLTESLGHLDGGSRAADEQAAAEADRAALAEDVERYAVLTFAEEILHGSIRRFEREHQPELLQQASIAFERMTRGRYLRIERRLDGSLLACRNDGRTVLPDALSTGTREQLFIALRLAYVASYAKSAESLPMVLDDVLVNFDEARTRGALEALAGFAERTQVLLFTCHASLRDRVRDVIPQAHHAEIPV
ncbi:AAA family ATPase [Pendulispora albinea]|uniref:AAA family ATPase n=1 Tax=Pendulispora albinea TaxID=2741071 RepID=A0ABZ2M5V9_9BACT